MPFKKSTHFLLIAVFAITACKKSGTPAPGLKTADIYVVGFAGLANGKVSATYWKNNVITQLTGSSTNSQGNAIAVQGNDVYVAGYYFAVNGVSVACYWKNGVIVKLTDSLADSHANSIAVQGSDVYVCGDKMNSPNTMQHAAYWKNGASVTLSDNFFGSIANGIAIQGNDVYLAGYTEISTGKSTATYWKNGVSVTVPPENVVSSYLFAVAVNDNGVHLAGTAFNAFVYGGPQISVASYWKNGAITKLNDTTINSNAFGIALQGSDVYIAGNILITGKQSIAAYWKNGVKTELNDGTAYADGYAVTVQGSDVYIAGDYNGGEAAYWKNGKVVPLAKISNNLSEARGIIVIPN